MPTTRNAANAAAAAQAARNDSAPSPGSILRAGASGAVRAAPSNPGAVLTRAATSAGQGAAAPARPLGQPSTAGSVLRAGAQGAGQGAASTQSNLAAIMAQSGSTNPADPYNWAGIAAALQSRGPGGSSSGGGSSYSSPSAPAAPAPAVYQAPSSVNPAPVNQGPSAITSTGIGTVGAPTGETFQSIGSRPGTFGQFDRLRNQRSPRTGLSITPEMLRRFAATRAAG